MPKDLPAHLCGEVDAPALATSPNGAFASYGDVSHFKGWIGGVSSSTRALTLWTSEASPGTTGGIWMSGSGIMSDGPGRIFVATSNGNVPQSGEAQNSHPIHSPF
jgi:hypothetical protein